MAVVGISSSGGTSSCSDQRTVAAAAAAATAHMCVIFTRIYTIMHADERADTRKTERAPYDMCAGVFDCNSETDGELEIRRSELVRIECALWESRERTQR